MAKRSGAVLLLAALFLVGCGGEQAEEQATEQAAVVEEEAAGPKPGDMALVPAGEFIMGSNEVKDPQVPDDWRFYPEHKINLPAFYIDKFEVTNAEFLKFTAETGYVSEADKENKSWRLFFSPEKANYPVVNVTWNDAAAYAKWAGKRLPTEQEWEKAARGTDGRRYPWGNEWKAGAANTAEAGAKNPREVGRYKGDVSVYGVYDMLGNVQEWTASWYKAYPGNKHRSKYYGEQLRVVRGASSRHFGKLWPLWNREGWVPGALYGYGFRCAKDAEKANLKLPEKPLRMPLERAEPFSLVAAVIQRHLYSALSTKHFR